MRTTTKALPIFILSLALGACGSSPIVTTSGGGGGASHTVTGQTALEVVKEVYGLPPSVVETINPGPVVNSSGFIGNPNDVVAEGLTQAAMTPSMPGPPGSETTTGGGEKPGFD